MATQFASLRTSPSLPITRPRNRKRQLRTAHQIYENIGGMAGGKVLDLAQCRMLHFYLTEFLGLPEATLRAWEQNYRSER